MKINEPGGHLDQLLRQTRAHHVQLSSMADLKANMLMTMSSLVITLAVPHTFSGGFRWALIVMIFFCLFTILLAAYAVMPKLPLSYKADHLDAVNNPKFNILFFGDFIHLEYAEFEAAMESVLNDPSRAYEVQVREIYTLGRFLALKKYRFLRLAYTCFIVGLFSSFAVLLLAR